MSKTSQYRGVSKHRPSGSWVATIVVNGKPRCLGYSRDEGEASLLVDNARLHLQEFFPKPLNVTTLNNPIEHQTGILPPVAKLRETLLAENAPRYRLDEGVGNNQGAVPEASAVPTDRDKLARALSEADAELTTIRQSCAKLGDLLTAIRVHAHWSAAK